MDVNLDTAGGVAVVELLGDTLDVSNAEDVKNRLTYLATEHPRLVVDLARVGFVDSAGCGALIAAHKRFREAGGDLRVCGVNPAVKTVFDIARLTRVLGAYPTREAAAAALGQ